MGNYLLFYANKLGGNGKERDTLEWIAKCQIVHHCTISVIPLGTHNHKTWK